MRADALGFFWEDKPIVKALKEAAPKRTPPVRTWERPDYLPGLRQALEFRVDLFTDEELVEAAHAWVKGKRHRFVWDIECYPNYFLVAFKSLENGKVCYFELGDTKSLDTAKLRWILDNFCHISFNGIGYDAPILALALSGCSTEQLWEATKRIIVEQERPQDVLKAFKVKRLVFDHIDLMEVAPLRASLKIYGGRLHTRRMQDLPFVPGTWLSFDQRAIVRWYCLNDLSQTADLHNALVDEIALREMLSAENRIDLRSKSDAQIAESVIGNEIERLNGFRAQKPIIAIGTAYKYHVPYYMQFQTPLMNWVLNEVRSADFVVDESGSIGMPRQLANLEINIGTSTYKLGIGGLHSTEQSTMHYAGEDYVLKDVDVESYYPRIILNQGLFPSHLGRNFLTIYNRIVERRIDAKHRGDTKTANSLKITINGSFGKLGSKYSILYAPDLLIQTTVTGQLSLLMLIERLELHNIRVVSANTDGVVIKCHKSQVDLMDTIIAQWEQHTNFKTEATFYSALYSRDVNNYVAVYSKPKEDKKTGEIIRAKTKGAFAKPGLSKNPANWICSQAVVDFLTQGIDIRKTIISCTDITSFVNVRNVKGGAVKVSDDTEYLGKSIRWYYAEGQTGELVYATTGNKVPRSDGAKPLMELPDELPGDINYEWYIKEAESILGRLGCAA